MMCSKKCKKIAKAKIQNSIYEKLLLVTELSNIEIDYLKKEIINNNKIIKK